MIRVVAMLILLCEAVCFAQSTAPYRCHRISSVPVIDGRINDKAWQNAPVITLVDCRTGEAARHLTRARMCWDDSCLYIAFNSRDSDIRNHYLSRDESIFNEELVEVYIVPGDDLLNYFEINLSPRNVLFDAKISVENEQGAKRKTDKNWNCPGIKSAVLVDGTIDSPGDTDNGWTAEIAIPFAALAHKAPRVGDHWRINLYRIEKHPAPEQYQAWSPTMDGAFHRPYRFGVLEFCEH